MVFFEVLKSGFQVGPELLLYRIAEFAFEVGHAVLCEPRGEDVHGYEFLAIHLGIKAYGVQLLDAVVGHGHAPYGDTAAVDVDIAAQVAVAHQAVGVVGVAELQGQVVVAFGIKIVDEVIPLRHLPVALRALGTEHSGEGADAVRFNELVFGGLIIACPQLQVVLRFKGADVNITGRVGDPFFGK